MYRQSVARHPASMICRAGHYVAYVQRGMPLPPSLAALLTPTLDGQAGRRTVSKAAGKCPAPVYGAERSRTATPGAQAATDPAAAGQQTAVDAVSTESKDLAEDMAALTLRKGIIPAAETSSPTNNGQEHGAEAGDEAPGVGVSSEGAAAAEAACQGSGLCDASAGSPAAAVEVAEPPAPQAQHGQQPDGPAAAASDGAASGGPQLLAGVSAPESLPWWRVSDSQVKPVPWSAVAAAEAYILLYMQSPF